MGLVVRIRRHKNMKAAGRRLVQEGSLHREEAGAWGGEGPLSKSSRMYRDTSLSPLSPGPPGRGAQHASNTSGSPIILTPPGEVAGFIHPISQRRRLRLSRENLGPSQW